MPRYEVLVTGTCYIKVDANSSIHAQEVAQKKIGENRFGIWDMAMNFACDECDVIAPKIDSPEWANYKYTQIARFKELGWEVEPDLNCEDCRKGNRACDECVEHQLGNYVVQEIQMREEV
jgi:hypothetical protein